MQKSTIIPFSFFVGALVALILIVGVWWRAEI